MGIGTNTRGSKATICVACGFCFLMLGSKMLMSTPQLGHMAAASKEYDAMLPVSESIGTQGTLRAPSEHLGKAEAPAAK